MNKVPVQLSEMSVESQSQTPPTHLRTVDLETGELFELPPEDEDETDYYGEI
ncbi:TraG protein [Streptococcus infantarius subsp. infantarius]|nr:TraG protein [Streptococcus infantarius subsp. infantarius]